LLAGVVRMDEPTFFFSFFPFFLDVTIYINPWWMDAISFISTSLLIATHLPSLPIAFSVAPCLYSTLSPPCRSKQTMMRRMDDRMDGQIDDGTNGWNDASRRPLLYVIQEVASRLWMTFLLVEKISLTSNTRHSSSARERGSAEQYEKNKRIKTRSKLGIWSYEFGRRTKNGCSQVPHLSSCSFLVQSLHNEAQLLMPPKKKRKILCHPGGGKTS
jgi:hypothetical protein